MALPDLRLGGQFLEWVAQPAINEIAYLQFAGRYGFLGHVPPVSRACVLEQLRSGEAHMSYFRDALSVLFESNESNGMTNVTSDLRKVPKIDELAFFQSEPLIKLIGVFLALPNRHYFRRPLGAFFARMPVHTFEQDRIRRSDIETGPANIHISPTHTVDWYLCDDAEYYLNAAIQTRRCGIGNESLLIISKPELKQIAGICIQSQSNKDGSAFIEGNWYCPLDQPTRAEIRRVAQNMNGPHRLDLEEGTWMHIRELRDNAETGRTSQELFLMAQALA